MCMFSILFIHIYIYYPKIYNKKFIINQTKDLKVLKDILLSIFGKIG